MPASPLITPEWLHSKRNIANIKIFDCSYHLGATGRDAYAEYLTAHIKRAHFFDIDKIADTTATLPHMLPGLTGFQRAIDAYDIKENDTIICYDNSPLHSSARVWWMFRYFGLNEVYILDGGQAAWRKAGYPLTTGKAIIEENPDTNLYKPKEITSLSVSRTAVQTASISKIHQILDARSKGRFTGSTPEPRPNLPSGHIPNSINLPFQSLFNNDGTYKSPNDIKIVFEQLDINLDQPITATCGSGITACTIAVALSLLGKWDTSIYDGAWIDWASHHSKVGAATDMIRTGK